MTDELGDSPAKAIWGRLTLRCRLPARAAFFLFGNRYALLVVLASFYAAFIVSVLEKYYAPLIRGGTETYDIHVHAYNVLYDHSISYSFLPGDLEQDVDHPHAFAQDVHVRAAFSQRFVGAAVLLLGFVDVHTFLLILCLGFCATFIGVVFQLSADHGYLRSSRGYPIAGALVLLYTLCDKNGLVMLLKPCFLSSGRANWFLPRFAPRRLRSPCAWPKGSGRAGRRSSRRRSGLAPPYLCSFFSCFPIEAYRYFPRSFPRWASAQNYPELRYYLCLNQPDCETALPELQRRGAVLIAQGTSYFLVQLAPPS